MGRDKVLKMPKIKSESLNAVCRMPDLRFSCEASNRSSIEFHLQSIIFNIFGAMNDFCETSFRFARRKSRKHKASRMKERKRQEGLPRAARDACSSRNFEKSISFLMHFARGIAFRDCVDVASRII